MRFLGDRLAPEATTANPHRPTGKPEKNDRNRKPTETCRENEKTGEQHRERHWCVH